jgi:2-keto-4-pentenoate hydratase/2-oxohepta-3-ene-1,7-dioic acid hydratase in catechol pathway
MEGRLKIVVFGPERRTGALVTDRVVDLNRADPRIPSALVDVIESGDAALDLAEAALDRAASGTLPDDAVLDVATLTLHAPAVHRPRIGCAAGNYALHTLGSARRKGVKESNALAGLVEGDSLPTPDELVRKTRERGRLRGFWKDFANPHGPGADIPYPDRCQRLDYEGEVVAVIGRRAKDVAAGDGGNYVWGISLHNDWSIRQENVKEVLSFNLPKNFDGSSTVGPCIVVGADPSDVEVETRVNGELRQKYHSADMIFSHADFIEFLSRDFTLLPGDMISGGSGPGTATDAEKDLDTGEAITEQQRLALYLRVGDVVEVSSPTIGTLRNRIVAKHA